MIKKYKIDSHAWSMKQINGDDYTTEYEGPWVKWKEIDRLRKLWNKLTFDEIDEILSK